MKRVVGGGSTGYLDSGYALAVHSPLSSAYCIHVTELATQIHVRICARSGALIASAIRLSLHLHSALCSTRPLQGAAD